MANLAILHEAIHIFILSLPTDMRIRSSNSTPNDLCS
jgi:hypothetical protein